VDTPNLDKLAEDGVLFENAFIQCPVCTPSRASFLTGRYPRTTRCRQNGQSIPEDEILVSKLFADAGYYCGLIGKQHISACDPKFTQESERRIDDGYQVFTWSHDDRPWWSGNKYQQWLQSLGVQYVNTPHPDSSHVSIGMPEEFHHTTWCANNAISFIEEASNKQDSWFLTVNFFDPHPPFNPPHEYLQRYIDVLDTLPEPNFIPGELENKPKNQKLEHEKGIHDLFGKFIPAHIGLQEHKLIKASYWAMVDVIDKQIGRIIKKLEDDHLLENTIVIFMSDHGEMLGDHGMYLKGGFFYEPLVKVPLIMSGYKAFASGQRIKGLFEFTDITPTLLELVGIKPLSRMQGRSHYASLIRTATSVQKEPIREDVYSEFYNAQIFNPPEYVTMLRTERYKIIVQHMSEDGELYDLAEDPQESVNLWNCPHHTEVKIRLLKRLCDRMAYTIDPLPIREARF
jgi:arylsulfatase A-like enzyme